MRHRPIGIGVQGLADVFFKMNIPFHSEEAKQLNFEIFETIYHGAVGVLANWLYWKIYGFDGLTKSRTPI